MAPVIRRLYDQMLEPKWAIAMGACCSSTGVFNNYALVAADKFMPIDVHVPGCPPRPEALMHGILLLRDKIHCHKRDGWRQRYDALGQMKCAPSNRQQTHQPDRRSPGDQLATRTHTPPGGVPVESDRRKDGLVNPKLTITNSQQPTPRRPPSLGSWPSATSARCANWSGV
jgi:NADH ubiquinone oxidoreductase subunit